MLMLNSTVPISCTSDASQSIRSGSHDAGRQRRRRRPGSTSCATFAASAYWRYAAPVKNNEPTKNVIPIPVCELPRTCDATPP